MFEDMLANQIDSKLAEKYSSVSDDDKIFLDLSILAILAQSDKSIEVKRERIIKNGQFYDRMIIESPLKIKR
jgi:predicted ATPase